MERLVEIVPRRGNPILYSTWYRSPGIVDNAQGSIAMPNFVWRNHASCDQIVDLIEIDLLLFQLFPDRIKSLYPTFNPHKRDTRFRHLCFDSFGNAGEERFILCAPLLELLGQLSIVFGVQMTKCEIFQLSAQLTHSQAVCDGRENLHGLFGNP